MAWNLAGAMENKSSVLTDEMDRKVTHPQQKLDLFAQYYAKLYASSDPPRENMEKVLDVVSFPSSGMVLLDKLNSPITKQEIENAISTLKPNKAPGFMAEFYKPFKEVLSKRLQSVFEECLVSKRVPMSWMEKKIMLIPKPEKNLTQPQTYRPISRLNLDYKILTTILAARLNLVLSKCIHMDQSGFLKDRQMEDNVKRVIRTHHLLLYRY